MPDELKNCQYLLVEYAPSALRETRLPIGCFCLRPPAGW